MQDKIEAIKKQVREYPVDELLDKPQFLDKIIEMTIAEEDIDEIILDLFEAGFEELMPEFEKAEAFAETECLNDIKAALSD